MFKNNFVVSIRDAHSGLFYREQRDVIRLPFGSEYSIFLKNVNTQQAVVSITVDDVDVLGGNRLVVNGKSNVTLDGFLDGLNATHKFKFIERIPEIEKHRGVYPTDGIISVTFDYVKAVNYVITTTPSWSFTYTTGTRTTHDSTTGFRWNSTLADIYGKSVSYNDAVFSFASADTSHQNENGITVKGSRAEQTFSPTFVGELENKPTTISFKLLGVTDVEEGKIHTRKKIQCSSCGLLNKNHYNFCSRCGTSLT